MVLMVRRFNQQKEDKMTFIQLINNIIFLLQNPEKIKETDPKTIEYYIDMLYAYQEQTK